MTLQKPGEWTEADELDLGQGLYDTIRAHITAGEDIPDELFGAAEGFLETSAIMAHQSDGEAGEAWFAAFNAFDKGLRRLTADAEMRSQGFDPSASDLPFEYSPPEAVKAQQPSLYDEYAGPSATDSMRTRPFALSPEAIRNHSILTGAPQVDPEGRPVVIDSDGMTWDLSEALGEFQKPEVREALRASLQGVVPGPEVLTNTLGAMPMAQMALHGVSKAKGALGLPETANLRTAQPGFSVPWTLPIDDFEEKIQDPLWTRALLQTVGEMEKSGELDTTALETVTRTVAGLADFVVFSKGLTGGLKTLGSAVVKIGVGGVPGMAGKALAAGRSPISFPLNTHFGRLAADFMSYEVATKAFDDRTTVPQDLLKGFESAAVFGAFGAAARFTRAPLSRLGGKLLGIEKAVPASLQTLDDLHAQVMKSNESTLLGALKKIEAKPLVREAAKKTVDSFLTGMYVHAFHEAQASEGAGFETFWKSLLTPNALATGLGFAIGTGIQGGVAARQQLNGFFQGPGGRQMMRTVAERLASPRASEDVRAVWDKFDAYRKTAPNVFRGIVKTNASARETLAQRETALQAIRELVGWHPERGEVPTAAGTRPRAIPPVEDGVSAMDRFRTWVEVGEGALRAAGAEIKRPTYEVGEIPKQVLQDIGFAEHKHAINAVNKYLRETEGEGAEQFKRLESVPRAVWMRTLEARDKAPTAEIPKPSDFPLLELAAAYEKVAGHPEYRDRPPLEAALEAKAKEAKGRPSLDKAVEMVRSGKKSAEWLAEKFPEGRDVIGKGKPAEWESGFKDAVRGEWKKQSTARLLRLNAERAKPETLQDFVAKNSGLAFVGDLENFTRKENPRSDKRTVVYAKGVKRGMTIDDMAEKAFAEGFFPAGRPTEREFIDALDSNIRRAGDSYGDVARMAEKAVSGESLPQLRRGIESGDAPLPKDPAERQKFLEDTFAGDPNYAGMKPAEIVAQVMELRRQAGEGDPGAMLAGPPVSQRDRVLSFAEKGQRLVDDLRALEVIDPDSTRASPSAVEATVRLAEGDTSILGEKVPEAERAAYVERAKAIRDEMRGALEATFEPGSTERVALDALFDAVDSSRAGKGMRAESYEFFRSRGLTDEFGLVPTGVLEQLQRDAVERMWEQARGQEELGDFNAFSGIPIAFGGKWSRVEHPISWGKLYDNPTFRRIMERPVWRRVFRGITKAGAMPGINVFRAGPLSRPQSKEMQQVVTSAIFSMQSKGSALRHLEIRAGWLADALTAPFHGRRLPKEHSEFFVRGVESGAFANARSAADLEAMRPGTGYLFPIYEKYAEIMATVEKLAGPEGMGWLDPKQLERWGGGRYLMRQSVREQVDRLAQAAGRGEIPVGDIGRTMMREDGMTDPGETAMRIFDAPHLIKSSVESWSVLLRTSAAWFEPVRGEVFASASDLRQMHPLDAEDYVQAGVRIVPARGQDLDTAMGDLANSGRYDPHALLNSLRLQRLEQNMAKEGEPPQPGKMAYSPELANMIRTWLGESSKGPVYLPRAVLEEIGILTEELFTVPGHSTLAKIGRTVDLGGSWMKRGLTALRPAALVLDYTSSAVNNHIGRGLPLNDWILGHLGVKSTFTHQGFADKALYTRWIKEGAPETGDFKPPEGWTREDWGRLQRAKKYLDTAGYSTSVYAVIGPEVATAHGVATDNPEQLRSSLELQLNEHAAKHGLTLSQRERYAARISDIAMRDYRGIERLDAGVAKLMDEADPAAHARGIGQFTAMRHLLEIFSFKYPAYLKMLHEHPDVAPSKLIRASIELTSNVGDTTALSRRWLSLHTPWNDVSWQRAQGSWKVPFTDKRIGKAMPRMVLAQLFRNRFYSYPQTMAPQMLKWHLTNPVGIATAFALQAGVTAAIWSLLGEDERKRKLEELAASRAGAVSWMAQLETERAHYEKALQGYRVGPLGGGLKLPASIKERSLEMWRSMPDVLTGADPFVIPMPEHGGESRSASLGELTPTGFLMGRARNQAGAIGGLVGAGEGRARDGLQGVGRMLGLTAQAVLGTSAGVLTGDDPVIQALGGKGSLTEALADKTFRIMGTAGVLYPKLGMFTPEGIFIGENVALNGQSWREALRGVERFHNPQDAASLLAGSGLRLLWPSRAAYPRPALNASEDAWTALLQELYGPGFSASSESGRDKTRAGRWGMAQMAVMLGDLYALHFDQAGEPGQAEITLDERVVGATQELMHGTVETLDGWQIAPGHEPKGVLMKSIAGLPPGVQPHAIDFLRRWLTRETFTQDGLSWLFLAGNARQMEKGLFRQAMMNALDDPSGTNLLGWWAEQIRGAGPEVLGQLAPLINDVRMPASGSAAHRTWTQIMVQYARAGIRLPPLPAEGQKSVDEILAGERAHRALQGGPALENMLRKRQPTSPLEEAFTPR